MSAERPAFQQEVARFVAEYGLEIPVDVRLLDLVSEVGEVSKEVLKATQYGSAPFAPAPNWPSELGDTLFALACLANSTGVDLHAALAGVLATYRRRLEQSGSPSSGGPTA